MRLGHTGLGVVRNDQRRDAMKMFKGVYVATQPWFHLLIARRLGPGVATSAERGTNKDACQTPPVWRSHTGIVAPASLDAYAFSKF